MRIDAVVINVSPLITLFRSGQADLLPRLFTHIVVPGAVWQEVVLDEWEEWADRAARELSKQSWPVRTEVVISPRVAAWGLGVSGYVKARLFAAMATTSEGAPGSAGALRTAGGGTPAPAAQGGRFDRLVAGPRRSPSLQQRITVTEAALRTYESLAEFAPDWVAIPGESINDLLEERGWTQADLATRTGFTTKHVNLLLKGKAPISEETALRLERVLGSTARFWLNLEAQYREHVARQESVKSLAQHIDWLKELPLSEMVKCGWVRKAKDKARQVFECLRYFGVADVDAWREQYERPVAAYRAAEKLIRTPAAVSAWLRCGERAAEDMRLGDFDGAEFESALQSCPRCAWPSAVCPGATTAPGRSRGYPHTRRSGRTQRVAG